MTRRWSRCSPSMPGSPSTTRACTSRCRGWRWSTSGTGSAATCTTAIIQSIYAVTLSLEDVPELLAEAPAEAGSASTTRSTRSRRRSATFATSSSACDRCCSTAGPARGAAALADEMRRKAVTEWRSIVGGSRRTRGRVRSRRSCSRSPRGAEQRRAPLAARPRRHRPRADRRSSCASRSPTTAAASRRRASIARGHHGLANMRARAEALGGTFDREERTGPGTVSSSRSRAPDPQEATR